MSHFKKKFVIRIANLGSTFANTKKNLTNSKVKMWKNCRVPQKIARKRFVVFFFSIRSTEQHNKSWAKRKDLDMMLEKDVSQC